MNIAEISATKILNNVEFLSRKIEDTLGYFLLLLREHILRTVAGHTARGFCAHRWWCTRCRRRQGWQGWQRALWMRYAHKYCRITKYVYFDLLNEFSITVHKYTRVKYLKKKKYLYLFTRKNIVWLYCTSLGVTVKIAELTCPKESCNRCNISILSLYTTESKIDQTIKQKYMHTFRKSAVIDNHGPLHIIAL